VKRLAAKLDPFSEAASCLDVLVQFSTDDYRLCAICVCEIKIDLLCNWVGISKAVFLSLIHNKGWILSQCLSRCYDAHAGNRFLRNVTLNCKHAAFRLHM
jgi:hypothetical protein